MNQLNPNEALSLKRDLGEQRQPAEKDRREELTVWVPEMDTMATKAAQHELDARGIEVKSDTDLAIAGDRVKVITQAYNNAENFRQLLVRPLNEHVKNINKAFKNVTIPLLSAKEEISTEQTRYSREKQHLEDARATAEKKQKEDEALKLAADLEEAGHTESAERVIEQEEVRQQITKPAEKPAPVRTAQSTTYTVKVPDYTIEDITKVPGPFLLDNRKVIMAEIRAQLARGIDAPSILGLKVTVDIKTRTR